MHTRMLIAFMMLGAVASSASAAELTGHVGVYPAVLSVPVTHEHTVAANPATSNREIHLVPAINGGDWISGRLPLRCQRGRPPETNPGRMVTPCVVI